jgi:hypothetical protein
MEKQNFLLASFAGILLFGVNLPKAGAVTQKERRAAIAESRRAVRETRRLVRQDKSNERNLRKFEHRSKKFERWAEKWKTRKPERSAKFRRCAQQHQIKAGHCRNIAHSIRGQLNPFSGADDPDIKALHIGANTFSQGGMEIDELSDSGHSFLEYSSVSSDHPTARSLTEEEKKKLLEKQKAYEHRAKLIKERLNENI